MVSVEFSRRAFYSELQDVTLTISAEPVPIRVDDTGVARVGATRVTLDLVVESFEAGSSAEEIVHQFPSRSLPDVYAAISYYLRYQDDIQVYLEERRALADRIQAESESRYDGKAIRERLLARSRRGGLR